MKVNISYQVDIEEIPETIGNLINRVYLSICDKSIDIRNIAERLMKRDDLSSVLRDISVYREHLARQDLRLDELSIMLAQFQKVEAEIFLAEKNEETPPTQEELVERMNDLKEGDFKNLVKELTENDTTDGNSIS